MKLTHLYFDRMFQRLPSPSALRTFEAAARLGSFKEAAAELGVTPTAVSHQIRALEDSLGTALFIRRTRAVELTEAGAALSPAVHTALLGIKTAIEDVAETESALTVTTTAAFAALRLVPKLADFEARYPEIKIQLMTGAGVVDLRRDRRVDVAIRYAVGPHTGFHEVPLISEEFGAYCAPDRFSPDGHVARHPLIETAWQQPPLEHATWETWLKVAGEAAPGRLRISRYEEEHFVLQAALAGQGLALMSNALVGDAIDRKLLVPYRAEIQIPGGKYTALCLQDRATTRRIRLFTEWLEKEFAELRDYKPRIE